MNSNLLLKYTKTHWFNDKLCFTNLSTRVHLLVTQTNMCMYLNEWRCHIYV